MNSNDYMPTVNSLKGRNKEMNEKLSLDEVKEKVQEMLDEAERNSEFSIYYTTQEKFSDQGATETCEKVLELLKKVEQPTPVKPVVPQAVADWFEENKDDLENRIWSYLNEWRMQTRTEFYMFMFHDGNKPIETLIKMKLFGYTVEQPKRWVVRQGGSEVWYLQGFRNSLDGDIVKQWCSYEGCIKFTDKAKAEAVATLVEGSVEEV